MQKFLDGWKMAKIILILKGGRSANETSSYRPIHLLNTINKQFQTLIRTRLENVYINTKLILEKIGLWYIANDLPLIATAKEQDV